MSDFDYIDAIALLGNYYKRKPYYDKEFESTARIFNGAWNRNNIAAVEAVLKDHDPHGLNEGKFNDFSSPQPEINKIKALLEDLKTQLILAGKPINPHGALSKCIDKIQTESKLVIINVYEVNKEIKSNNTVHAVKQTKSNEEFSYYDAITLLGKYSGNQPYYSKGYEYLSRLFSGAWNRKNVAAVETVLKDHDPYGLKEGKLDSFSNTQTEQSKIETLLTDLKNQIIKDGKEINPEGTLAKTINQIQTQSNTNVIDIDDLNAEIKNNEYSNKLAR